jgi:hypothetical protein
MRTKNKLSLSSIIALFLLFPIFIAGQESQYNDDRVLDCDYSVSVQDNVIMTALEQTREGGFLIIIIKPGDGETSPELTRRRLYNLREYFLRGRGSHLKLEKVIFAKGDQVKGYGRIEYYLGGKLFERLLFRKNGYICHECCGLDDRYYPEKAAEYERQKKQKQKRKRRG